MATLQLIDDLGLVANAGIMCPYLLERLEDAVGSHANVAEVRGIGLMAAVEFMESPAAGTGYSDMAVSPAISTAMLKRGVIARAMPEGNIIGIAPSLYTSRTGVDHVTDALRAAVHEVLGK